MKKAFNFLIAGCVLSALAVNPASYSGLPAGMGGVVEASPVVALITGTVKDDRGAPLAGAIVALLEQQTRGKEIKSVKTDYKGQFSTDAAPGIYRLRAIAEGFAPIVMRVKIDRPGKVSYDFALKRTDTLVQKRGDSEDYRWIARSVPRHAMNLKEENQAEADQPQVDSTGDDSLEDNFTVPRPTFHSFHGMAQFVASSSSGHAGMPSPGFFGSNFAVSGSFGGNVEMALIGQRGMGYLAPQRLSAIASVRPSDRHQVTASVGYGRIAMGSQSNPIGLTRKMQPDLSGSDFAPDQAGAILSYNAATAVNNGPRATNGLSLDQLSVSAVGSWQVFQPLLLIYGFDYSRFMGSIAEQDTVLPRFAVQYSPSSRTRLSAAMTPGADQNRQSLETFDTENIQANFETSPAEIAFNESPILDRSRRFEVGAARLFGNGESSIEASAFYDLISGHGVGILALPLEASPETQVAFQQVANQVTAMNGAARGVRVMYRRILNDHVSTSLGYSFGRGARFNNAALDSIGPAQMFRGGFFQVATAKLDLDFTHETGTRISTVIRLSPSAVIFAIDPFAGQMSIYDPNINIYVTQDLPNFGLPVRWQAIVDVRNLLDQATGVDDGAVQLIAARTRRTLRGGVAFRW